MKNKKKERKIIEKLLFLSSYQIFTMKLVILYENIIFRYFIFFYNHYP